MATFTRFSSIVEVPVVTQEGETTTETRTLINTPMAYYFPGDPLVVCNWLADGKKPDVETVKTPITVENVQYFGCYGWGSMVKKGFTLGLTRDYLTECDMADHNRDGVRMKRWLLADGLYGATVANDLKVKVMDEGTVLNGLPVEDGFGYISKSAAAALWNGHQKIKSNGARESFQFWSQLPWDEVKDEITPYLIEDLLLAADPVQFAFDANSPAMEEKRPFMEADPAMEYHRSMTNAFGRSAADLYRRTAGTVRTDAHWKVAVPSLCSSAAIEDESVLYRYPIDDFSAVRVADADASDEAARIAEMEVIQFSLSSLEFFASGCLGIVDDELLDGHDIVLCGENIKLAQEMKWAKMPGTKIFNDIVLCATQWYEAGSALGLNAKYWKKMGGDFDGDLVFHFAVEGKRSFRAVAKAIQSFPKGATLKLKKSRISIKDDRRAEMIVNNMNNIVGFASNLRETVFMIKDHERLAEKLGFQSAKDLFETLNFFIKAGTDGFKSFVIYDRSGKPVTMDQLEKRLGILQSNLITLLGMMAPETGWKRSDWAFRQDVPAVIGKEDEVPSDKDEKKLAIQWWMQGTVQELAKIALPNISAAIGSPIESKPLTYYRPWAGKVSDELYAAVHNLQLKFNARIDRLNWQWSEQVEAFKLWWRTEIENFISETGEDRLEVAKALWNVAHSSRSKASGAGSVFMGMPEEALRIIKEKPGRETRKPAAVVMTGLTYNVQNALASWVGEVEVVYHTVLKNGKSIHRACICPIGNHPFEFKAKDDSNPWPHDMIGVVSAQDDQPLEGFYSAAYSQKSKSSWALELSA